MWKSRLSANDLPDANSNLNSNSGSETVQSVSAEALTALPRAYSKPAAQGLLRVEPADFQVRERLGFEPDGQGEHVLLYVRKTLANTEWVARQLARFANVPQKGVGYAGRKDRLAVTEQWFSLQLAGKPEPDWTLFDAPGCVILQHHRHQRKLRHGAITGNDFRCVLRAVQGDISTLPARAAELAEQGVPNYFGPQRFGHAGGNLQLATQWFQRQRRLDRNQRSIALSAARSFLFNQVLAIRVENNTWQYALPGDVLQLDGSRSHFQAEQIDVELAQRVGQFDLHPSGPLWGRGTLASGGSVSELEQAVATQYSLLAEGLERAGLEQERRALRVRPGQLQCEILSDDTALIEFSLPPGAYATTLLREWIDYREPELPGKISGQTAQ